MDGEGCRRARRRRSRAARCRAPGGCRGPAGGQERRGCWTRARGEIPVLAPQVVDQVQRRRLPAGAHHLGCGLQEGTHLGIAVGRAADRVSVDPQRGVVEECAPVHLCHVDLALDPVGERVESADHVVPVHPHVEREVVARLAGTHTNGMPCAAATAATTASDPAPPAIPSASAPATTACRASASRSWPGARMTASISFSRARSASPARAALPSPDPGLTNSTGRRGGPAGRQP